jgi:hypothetical protein
MTTDVELESWRRHWQGRSVAALDAEAAERLRRRVLRETRWLKLSLVIPILVTLGIGGAVILRAVRTGQPLEVVLAVETWGFIVVVWAAALWTARGTWRPIGETTAAFVAVSVRRREANLRGSTWAVCLYVFQLLFIVLTLAAASPAGIMPILTSKYFVLIGWIGVPSGLAALFWFRRRQRADLERLRELERQLRGD